MSEDGPWVIWYRFPSGTKSYQEAGFKYLDTSTFQTREQAEQFVIVNSLCGTLMYSGMLVPEIVCDPDFGSTPSAIFSFTPEEIDKAQAQRNNQSMSGDDDASEEKASH